MSDTEQSRITEDQPRITREHVKDPKKVAAGEKLAFLRAEKRRLEKEHMAELEERLDACFIPMAPLGMVALVGLTGYFTYRWFSQKPEQQHEDQRHVEVPKKSDEGSDLFTLD